MNLITGFERFIADENLFQKKDRLLLAVSGGVDSVVLCDLCSQAGYDFVIAHCNFQLRGEESERDEKFVRGLGEKYGVEVFVKRFDTDGYAKENKKSIQEAARDLRYRWFIDLCTDGTLGGVTFGKNDKPGWHATIDYSKPRMLIVTAHHANDSVETMLMNFFKGTGIKGLQGIKPRHEPLIFIVRPLLFSRKDELIEFAKQNNLSFVEDSSNSSDKYTRNYFRNTLLPSLKKVYPDVENNLIDNLNRFREIEMLYQQAINLHKKKLLEQKGNETHIPVLKLLKTEPLATVLYEIISDFNFTSYQTDEVIALLQSESGKYIQSSTHRIIKNRNWLIVTSLINEESQNVLIEQDENKIEFEGGILKIEEKENPIAIGSNYKIQNNSLLAQLDASVIKFPLLLRKWKQGDYFYPLGMKKKKKLSRFFIDEKLSLPQKENAWVIEMDKKIIWVVGMRIDERFKIAPKTKNILLINYLPK